jgi:hypothetical protein
VPRFPFPERITPLNPFTDVNILLSSEVTELSDVWERRFPSRREITSIYKDTCRMVTLLQAESVRTKGEVYKLVTWAGQYIQPLTYRLLCLREAVDVNECSSIMQEIWRLAILLSTTGIRLQFGIRPMVWNIHEEKLKSLLEDDMTDWGFLNDLKLWIIVIGALKSVTEAQRLWFSSEFKLEMAKNNLTTYDEVEIKLAKYLWLPEHHGTEFFNFIQNI